MNRCNACGISKPTTAFSKQKQADGRYTRRTQCKACRVEHETKRIQTYTQEQKDKRRSAFLQKTYGITVEQYNEMFMAQHGTCKVCGRHQSEFKKSLVVDHRHSDGKVRGLLCSGCNLALGNVGESAEILENLAIYLRGTQ